MTAFTLFTSYRRERLVHVSAFERQLRLRGVRSWRDTRNIPHGSESAEEIRRAIRGQTDGMVAFVTAEYLRRHRDRPDIVWNVELPEAAARWSGGRYFMTPLFIGTTPAELRARCAEEHLPNLAGANGRKIETDAETPPSPSSREEALYRAEARDQLSNAVRSVDRKLVLAFRSFPMATSPADARLDVDWSGDIDRAPPAQWHEDLLPALRDLRDVVSESGVTNLDVYVLARLSGALALGMTIPLARGAVMTVRGRDGLSWGEDTDGSRTLTESIERLDGDGRVAVIDLSLVADLERDSREIARRVEAGHVLRLRTARMDRGPELQVAAQSSATQIGDALRRLRAQGVTDYHVLLASPAPMAVLIGRQMHALGRVHTYFSNEQREATHAYSMAV